jgi:16S rRNA (uracil1498-N3)-methyltransferase
MLDPDAAELVTAVQLPAAGEIVLVVGPEGGISPTEAGAFQKAGAVPARLGPTVLRASTAGVVAAGILLSHTERWANAPG